MGDLREFRYLGDAVGLTARIQMVSPDRSQTGQANLRSPGRNGGRLDFNGNIGFVDATPGGGGGGRGGGPRGGGGAGVNLRLQINDIAPDTSTFDVQAAANTAIPLDGIYYSFNFSNGNFSGGSAIITGTGSSPATIALAAPQSDAGVTRLADTAVTSIRITGTGNRSVEFTFANPTRIILQRPPRPARRGGQGGGRPGGGGGRGGPRPAATLLIPIVTGTLNPGAPYDLAFTLKATCDPDTAPITLTLNPAHAGPPFLGIGGNFRIQSGADAATIAYNLQNFRVSWARLEMPLSSWQTSETADPTTGRLANNVRQAMEMARTLAQKKIPMVISDWSAPSWAVATGTAAPRGSARSIAPEKWPAMYKAIASYIAYLKANYGAEPLLFSFNEADMGINVKLTPEDQDTVIKGLGAAFAAQGLATKMLLGDTGNPTPRPANYLDPTIADPDAMKYVGALSFHSWTGGGDDVIARWGQIAQRFKLPLLVAEGGTDPDSYRYGSVFLEPWYALDEINLYVRCLALARPAAILHWQLTDNYSVLTGGRNGQPLQPTERYYNLQQLNLTPPSAPSLGITTDRPHLTAAAYGDDHDGYAIHLVNTGATRPVTLTGLPTALTALYPTVTDGTRQFKALPPVPVSTGTAQFTLDAQSYVTLTSAKPL